MKKNKYIYVAFGLAIVVSVGMFFLKNNIKNNGNADISMKTDLGIPIEVISVTKSGMEEDISYIGTLSSKNSTIVSPAIGGQIMEIYFEEGDKVREGDTLAKIDDIQLSATLNTSLKKLETLKTNYSYLSKEVNSFYESNPLIKKLGTLTHNYEYLKEESEKYAELYKEGAIAKTTYDKIMQETDTAYLQMEELKASIEDAYGKLAHEKDMSEKQIEEVNASINELGIKLNDTLIKAPIQGVIKKIYGEKGDMAAMGKPYAEIDNTDEMLVKVNITEKDMDKLSLGDKAILKIKDQSVEVVSKISKIVPNVNPNTRVGVIEIGPIEPNEEIRLVSGNSVEVKIITNQVKDSIIIPKSALKNLDNQSIVYLYDDGKVTERVVTIGMAVGENVEIIDGIKETDIIAIKNLSKLYNNAKAYVFKGVDQ